MNWRGIAVLSAAVAGFVAACSPGYLGQAARGQWEVMRARRPVEAILADRATPPELRARLLLADQALVFAHTELALPRTGSYRHYADLGRPYVVWNVFAAPEFDLAPTEYCFPVAGCVPYRGYFAEAAARAEAARLRSRGQDVFVGGVPAYATLGWFDDPLLNTWLAAEPASVAATLFHELAHRRYYLAGDTPFNEGFASFVEMEGLRRWLDFRRDTRGRCGLARNARRRQAALELLEELRTALAAIYAVPGDELVRREAKAMAVAASRERYRVLRAGWSTPPWFDHWFGLGADGTAVQTGDGDPPVPNNASLAALASYEEHVPAFAALLADSGGDLTRFYAAVEALGALSGDARAARLADLARQRPLSAAPVDESCRSP